MSTIRQWLNEAGFNWNRGAIVHQEAAGYSPGWSRNNEIGNARVIKHDDPVLDLEFNSSYGAPQCPRFIARDDSAIYFPVQYDGATWIEKIVIDLNFYVRGNPTPYPGG